jgi:hypothetical protein
VAAIADLSDLVNRLTGGSNGTPEHVNWAKEPRISGTAANVTVAGRWQSLWMYDGSPSGGELAPTTVAVPTNATPGSLRQLDPSGGRQKWMVGVDAVASAAGTLLVYDRLLHMSGLLATNLGAQTVGGTLTRNTTGVGNEIWVEINTLIGVTATTITASYTNQDGTSGRTTQAAAFGGTGLREAQRIIRLPLQSGDTGVRAVASVTIAASTGTAGDYGVVVARPLLSVPLPTTGVLSTKDLISGFPAMLEVDSGACLTMAWLANGTVAPALYGSMHSVEA